MSKNTLIILVVVGILCIGGIALIAINSGGDDKKEKTIDHSMDTEMSLTFKWNALNGWALTDLSSYKVFVNQDKSYDSDLDNKDNSYIYGYEHDVTKVSGTMPNGCKIVVDHDGLIYWGYAWAVDKESGASMGTGTWTGTVTYTVYDDSNYYGTVHTLHYTLIKD